MFKKNSEKNIKKDKSVILKVFKALGSVLAVASIIFVVWYLVKMDVDYAMLLEPHIFITMIICGFIFCLFVFCNSFGWKVILEMFTSKKINTKRVFSIYGRANLAKYIPGNFMQYVTRNLLGKEYEIPQKQMALSTIIEVMLMALAGLLIVLVLAFEGLKIAVANAIQDGMLRKEWIALVLIVIAVVIIAIIIYMKKNNYLASLKWKNLLGATGVYVGSLLINSLTFIIVAFAISPDAIGKDPALFCGYYIIAWLIGFIVPGAPGGLGIREYIMLLLLGPYFGSSDASLIMITTRIFNVLGDILTYAYTTLLYRHEQKAKALKDVKEINVD